MFSIDYCRARRKYHEKKRRYQECPRQSRIKLNQLKQYYADPTNDIDTLGLLAEELSEPIRCGIKLNRLH